ncbi:MAG: biotin/lipoyl-containing protein, partial [Alphaproteobacteria bacterium]
MSIKILMPALSPTMTEGTLANWLVKEGDTVSSGQIIAEIETDKATMEVESIDDGVVGKIFVEQGTQNVAVNTLIAVLLEDGEDESALEGISADTPAPASTPADNASAPASPAPSAPVVEVMEVEPEWTGSFKKQTVREALRDAMAEEMRGDENVFLMGEEVAEYQGAY